MTHIAAYDFDRTIGRRGSWTAWLAFWLREEAPWRVVLLPLLVLAGAAFGLKLIDRGRLKELVQLVVMGRAVDMARVEAAARRFADAFVAADVFPEAAAAIAADRVAGRRVVIATASNGFYIDAIAARLGVADVVASRSRMRSGRVSWRLATPNCYGAAKAAMLAAWQADAGLAGAVLDFTSDHESDLPSFEQALASGGRAVAANPSAALLDIATRRGWPIVGFGTVIASRWERA